MRLIKILLPIIEKLFRVKIYRKLPFGNNPLEDIKYVLRKYDIKTVLDVGANLGQTAKSFEESFPKSKIYCIEPILSTFNELKNNTTKMNVSCYNLALGSENGTIDVKINLSVGNQTMNSLVQKNQDSNKFKEGPDDFTIEKITVQKLSDFCKSNSISHIDYLKIDTEGYDLEVLKGGKELLIDKLIDFVEVEVSMNPENKFHVDFFEVKEFLEDCDYRLFGIYEQVQEWIVEKPVLRRSNALYISKKMADRHSQS